MSSMELPELDQVTLQEEEKDLFDSSKSLFNSKLFINLDNTEQDNCINNENIIEEGVDNLIEFEEINYLSNELIKDLDVLSSISKEKEKETEIEEEENNKNITKNNIILDSLLSLAKDGYEFKPKNYKPYQIGSHRFIKQNNHKNINIYNRDKKNDWFCSYCNNLNFSFRNKCNKCKISKEISKKHKNYYMSRVI